MSTGLFFALAFVGNAVLGAFLLRIADPDGDWLNWMRTPGDFVRRLVLVAVWPAMLLVMIAIALLEDNDGTGSDHR